VSGLVDRARSTFLSGRRPRSPRRPARGAAPCNGRPPARRARCSTASPRMPRHAPESTPIRVAAGLENVHVAVSVSDEGSGGLARAVAATCSAGTPARDRARRRATASGSPSARGSSRRTAAASGPRAPAPTTTVTFTMPVAGGRRPGGQPRCRPAGAPLHPASRRASSWSTATRGSCASSPTRLPRPAGAPLLTGHAARPATHHPDRDAAAGAARPDVARRRRHRADAADPRACRPAGVIFISAYRRDETVAKALESAAADTSSSPSRRRSWWRGSGRRSDAAPSPSRSCSERSPSTTRSAG